MEKHQRHDTLRKWPMVEIACKDNPLLQDYWKERINVLFDFKVLNLGSGQNLAILKLQEYKCPLCF